MKLEPPSSGQQYLGAACNHVSDLKDMLFIQCPVPVWKTHKTPPMCKQKSNALCIYPTVLLGPNFRVIINAIFYNLFYRISTIILLYLVKHVSVLIVKVRWHYIKVDFHTIGHLFTFRWSVAVLHWHWRRLK